MTLPNLVSFSGYARSGKKSAADVLASRARFVSIPMSKPIVKALSVINPSVVDPKVGTLESFANLYESLGHDEAMTYEEVRRLMRSMATEFGRETLGADVWTDLVFDEVRVHTTRNKHVALSGVRYENELLAVRRYGGVTVWIDRPNVSGRNSNSTHDMITAEDCDVVVVNDGTVKDLYVKIVIALEEFAAEQSASTNTDRLV